METEDFLADLVAPIVKEIMGNPGTAPYYESIVLEALLQMSKPPYGTTRYVRQRLPPNINLNDALEYYKQLSGNHGFSDQYHILLELLSVKVARNEKRHLYFLVEDYKVHCREEKKRGSYHDYISYRGLVISPELSGHCKSLFQNLYRI
jgi:hypothetical protein